MPRSGYSREDQVVRRSGYVSQDNNPVDRRGGPESHSGRINYARMNGRASPETFLPSLNPPSRVDSFIHPLLPTYRGSRPEMTSIGANHLRNTKEEPEDTILVTSASVSSFGSNPQLGGLDGGYRDEGKHWPSDSPIKIDQNDYKRDEERGKRQIEEYESGEREWEKSRVSTAYLPTHLRSEDDYDQRQSLAAAATSRSYQSAVEKRNDHNNDYIGHWPRGKRKGHKDAVTFAKKKAVTYGKESQEHQDSRNRRWREKCQSDLEKYFPEED